MPGYRVKLIKRGPNQIVPLPDELRFNCHEVFIRKAGNEVILSPVEPSWDPFFDQESAFDEEFLNDRGEGLR